MASPPACSSSPAACLPPPETGQSTVPPESADPPVVLVDSEAAAATADLVHVVLCSSVSLFPDSVHFLRSPRLLYLQGSKCACSPEGDEVSEGEVPWVQVHLSTSLCFSHADSGCSAILAPLSSWLVAGCSGLVPTSHVSTVTTGGRSVSSLLTVTRRCTSASCTLQPILHHPWCLVLVMFDACQALLMLPPMQSLVHLVNRICQWKVNTGTPLGTSSSIPPALPMICLWAELAISRGLIPCTLPCSGTASSRMLRPSLTQLIAATTFTALC
jgi:hypothetical protein